ncbi:claudin 3c isoform X2 [Danio aesculapii]|uniref:claudin 3c isoform X2 n=2 Tax=Danio aesculapii TaxID=1142201 RepID=UPI0024BF8B51|nr:claudin 3c isoform X2 [Danio aesculapii]
MSMGLEIGGIALGIIGWIISIVACALPMWRVTAFVGTNIVTAQVIWEGLWMSCVVQSTGQMQCKVYDSMLALGQNLQASRAMTVIAIILAALGVMISIMGAKCTTCIKDEGAKANVMIASGITFIIAGILNVIPSSWVANQIIRDFYNPILTAAQYKSTPNMSMGLEIGGIALGIIGWIISIVACALPMWRVSAFVGANIVTAQVIWEGLWMNCVVQSTGQMQCKVYDSMLALGQDLQASRAMTIIAIILAVLGVMISVMGAKCTNCIEDEGAKAKVMIVSGIMFIIAGILDLIPSAWVANQIIRDFYNPMMTAQQREIGASIYIGFAAAALLIIGGAMLCCTCPPREKKYKPARMGYSAPRSVSAGYDKKDYV